MTPAAVELSRPLVRQSRSTRCFSYSHHTITHTHHHRQELGTRSSCPAKSPPSFCPAQPSKLPLPLSRSTHRSLHGVVHPLRQKGEEEPTMSTTAPPLLTAPAATDVALPAAAAVAATSPTGMYVTFEGSALQTAKRHFYLCAWWEQDSATCPSYPSLSLTLHKIPYPSSSARIPPRYAPIRSFLLP